MPESTIPCRCEHCGELVQVTPAEEAKGEPIYCSDRCERLGENFRAAEAWHDARFEEAR